MNIRFHNLGTIQETELDLKPLTVIIGPNNSNKTYIAYSIYGLWQSMRNDTMRVPFEFQYQADGSPSVLVEDMRRWFTLEITHIVANFEKELPIFFQDSGGGLFSRTGYEVVIPAQEFNDAVKSLPDSVFVYGGDEYRLSLEQDRLMLLRLNNPEAGSEGSIKRALRWTASEPELSSLLDMALRHQLFAHTFLLPAERNAFIITYKVLANRRLKLMLDAQRQMFGSRQTPQRQLDLLREAGEIRYPQPIEDFLELLSQIELEIKPAVAQGNGTGNGAGGAKRGRPARSGMGKLAGDIERTIQNGNTLKFRATALGGQEIMVDVGKGLSIDLYNASSSIKQLAPLLLYLRYRAAKGDLLIIDEPEMNLHPESQAKLLEVLAMLVNQGVYVLLTTHSPYLLAHLNNLAQAEDAPGAGKGASRRQAKSLYLGDPAALLRMDQVSAYEMRDNQLHSLKDPDYGIRWDTLSDVSVDLQQKYFRIYEEGHTPKRVKTPKTAGQ